MAFRFSALVVCVFTFSAVATAGMNEGQQFLESGQYDYALVEFTPLAQQKNAEAMFLLARTYEEGFDDTNNALHWYREAADAAYAEAQYRLGLFYEDGLVVEQDIDQALLLYGLAAEQNHADALLLLGQHLAEDLDDNAEAMRFYKRAADLGHTEAQFRLGLLYLGEPGVPRDEVSAWIYMSLAANDYEEAFNAVEVLELEMSAPELKAAHEGLLAIQQAVAHQE